MNNDINIKDNMVPYHIQEFIYEFIFNSKFSINGWRDREDINKHDIHSEWSIEDLKNSKLYPYIEKFHSFDKWNKCMVTLTQSSDHYYAHAHGDNCRVVLYYANLEWRNEWAGETLFYDHNMVTTNAIQNVPGRLVEFEGSLPHTIRPQSVIGPKYRFTISNFFRKV